MVTITLNERQLQLVRTALDEYARLRMGQALDFADDICRQNANLDGEKARSEDFDYFLMRRTLFKETVEKLIEQVAFDGDRARADKTPNMMMALDIHDTIRHYQWLQKPEDARSSWTVDADEPFHWDRSEPLPKIEKVEG